MQPLLTSDQIYLADKATIESKKITSVDLMEHAAIAFIKAFISIYNELSKPIAVYCGTGNNGGDGLAIARLLVGFGYHHVTVKIAWFSEKSTEDFNQNLERLKQTNVKIFEYKQAADFPEEEVGIIIDALLGNGLNKPLDGEYKRLVAAINDTRKIIVSVDIPTGFFGDGEIEADALTIRSDLTITFQQPKINFLLPESKYAIKKWIAVDIGIDKQFIEEINSKYQYLGEADIKRILKPRERFSNKGTYGHALIIAGQAQTMGAALLSSSACVYAGAGLTTACVPESGLTALNSYMPEIMAVIREGNRLPAINWNKFSTVSIGPGLGQEEGSLALLKELLDKFSKPVVLDADALNLIAANNLLANVPKGSIITPHVKEFDRLFGEHKNWWQRLQTAAAKAKEFDIYIVLKNDYTIVASPDEKLYINSTSNAAMASGGMGDVLTGIITALLAQKYSPLEACLAGVYLHGKAGDDLAMPHKLLVVLAADVAKQVPKTIAALLK